MRMGLGPPFLHGLDQVFERVSIQESSFKEHTLTYRKALRRQLRDFLLK